MFASRITCTHTTRTHTVGRTPPFPRRRTRRTNAPRSASYPVEGHAERLLPKSKRPTSIVSSVKLLAERDCVNASTDSEPHGQSLLPPLATFTPSSAKRRTRHPPLPHAGMSVAALGSAIAVGRPANALRQVRLPHRGLRGLSRSVLPRRHGALSTTRPDRSATRLRLTPFHTRDFSSPEPRTPDRVEIRLSAPPRRAPRRASPRVPQGLVRWRLGG